MASVFERPLALVLQRAKGFVKSNPTTRRILYDMVNVNEFTDLKGHESMLADTTRVETYYRGISRHVRPGDVVVDLGTGSGILTFFAAQQGAKVVYAIDHSEIIELAKEVAAHNHLTNITFVRAHSRDFTTYVPVDVIIQEQMGDNLFNEHMIENILDLKRRLLRPGGLILPGKYELYLEPVSMLPAFRIPHVWEQEIHGVDFRFLDDAPRLQRYQRHAYDRRDLSGQVVQAFLAEPELLLRFDLNEMTEAVEFPRHFSVTRTVTEPGQFDGLCLYFRTIFDDEVSFDTSPMAPLTPSWTNHLFRLTGQQCAPGDRISYEVDIPDVADVHTWSVRVASVDRGVVRDEEARLSGV